MFGVYLFATLVGWPFVLFFLFFSSDVDADVDADLEFDADAAPDAGAGGVGEGLGDAVLSIFSFRAMVFLLAFFGATGLILDALDVHAIPTLLLALAMGLFAGYLHARLFAYLKRSSMESSTTNADLRGSRAKVVVPVSSEQKGRIEVDVEGRPVYVTARPFRDGTFEKGQVVVVVEVEDGMALVGPLNLDV